MDSEKHKSQSRPKRIQREQILLFGTTKQKISKKFGLNVTEPKHGDKKKLCNDFNNKKTIFMTFIDHGQKLVGQKKRCYKR